MKKFIMVCILMLIPTVVQATEEYEFAKDFITGLSLRKNIEEKLKLSENEKYNNELEEIASVMKLGYLANKEIDQAIKLLSKHANSKNPLIKETAESTINMYRLFISINNKSISFCEELYSPDAIRNQSNRHLGKELSELANMNADKEEVSRSLMFCAVMLTQAMTIIPEKENQVITHMAITSSERKNLITDIDSIFGETAKNGLQVGASYLDSSGAAIRQYLTGGLKSADEK